MQRNMWITALAASGLAAGMMFGASASASPIECGPYTNKSATANDDYADNCVFESPDGNQEARDQLVQDSFGDDEWTYIGKYDSENGAEDQANTGYWLKVTDSNDGQFSYSLDLTDPEPGTMTTIEWVLGVKQSKSFTAYYWDSVTLDIGGTFVSTFTAGDGETNAYSHIAGYVRNAETTDVPEPTALALLGGGLLALGWAMRRRSRSDFAG